MEFHIYLDIWNLGGGGGAPEEKVMKNFETQFIFLFDRMLFTL